MYTSFDAVDGKQARRTGSSSPLGELFDHSTQWQRCRLGRQALCSHRLVCAGCDALSTVVGARSGLRPK
jgi:hypothetical protein